MAAVPHTPTPQERFNALEHGFGTINRVEVFQGWAVIQFEAGGKPYTIQARDLRLVDYLHGTGNKDAAIKFLKECAGSIQAFQNEFVHEIALSHSGMTVTVAKNAPNETYTKTYQFKTIKETKPYADPDSYTAKKESLEKALTESRLKLDQLTSGPNLVASINNELRKQIKELEEQIDLLPFDRLTAVVAQTASNTLPTKQKPAPNDKFLYSTTRELESMDLKDYPQEDFAKIPFMESAFGINLLEKVPWKTYFQKNKDLSQFPLQTFVGQYRQKEAGEKCAILLRQAFEAGADLSTLPLNSLHREELETLLKNLDYYRLGPTATAQIFKQVEKKRLFEEILTHFFAHLDVGKFLVELKPASSKEIETYFKGLLGPKQAEAERYFNKINPENITNTAVFELTKLFHDSLSAPLQQKLALPADPQANYLTELELIKKLGRCKTPEDLQKFADLLFELYEKIDQAKINDVERLIADHLDDSLIALEPKKNDISLMWAMTTTFSEIFRNSTEKISITNLSIYFQKNLISKTTYDALILKIETNIDKLNDPEKTEKRDFINKIKLAKNSTEIQLISTINPTLRRDNNPIDQFQKDFDRQQIVLVEKATTTTTNIYSKSTQDTSYSGVSSLNLNDPPEKNISNYISYTETIFPGNKKMANDFLNLQSQTFMLEVIFELQLKNKSSYNNQQIFSSYFIIYDKEKKELTYTARLICSDLVEREEEIPLHIKADACIVEMKFDLNKIDPTNTEQRLTDLLQGPAQVEIFELPIAGQTPQQLAVQSNATEANIRTKYTTGRMEFVPEKELLELELISQSLEKKSPLSFGSLAIADQFHRWIPDLRNNDLHDGSAKKELVKKLQILLETQPISIENQKKLITFMKKFLETAKAQKHPDYQEVFNSLTDEMNDDDDYKASILATLT